MNMKPSPLRHLDLSDDAVAIDMAAEKARQLSNAYDHIDELRTSIRELLSLIHIISACENGYHGAFCVALRTNHIVTDAEDLLR